MSTLGQQPTRPRRFAKLASVALLHHTGWRARPIADCRKPDGCLSWSPRREVPASGLQRVSSHRCSIVCREPAPQFPGAPCCWWPTTRTRCSTRRSCRPRPAAPSGSWPSPPCFGDTCSAPSSGARAPFLSIDGSTQAWILLATWKPSRRRKRYWPEARSFACSRKALATPRVDSSRFAPAPPG